MLACSAFIHRGNVPDTRVHLMTAGLRSGHATDRATEPGK